MSTKPAVLLSDELVSLLDEKAICKISYEELTGTKFPWETDLNVIKDIQKRLDRIETNLRLANPGMDITCVISGEGCFWLDKEGTEHFTHRVKKPLEDQKTDGPLPVWKLTSGEIFNSHIFNMRKLILAVCHDMILLEHLKESLGENHTFITREFGRYERFVRILLEDMKEQGPNLSFALSENIIMLERAEITYKMIQNKTISAKELGYSEKELAKVIEILDSRCKGQAPMYRKRLQAVYNQMQNALRDGETTQLTRASRWEFAFGLIKTPPVGYKGQIEVTKLERKSLQEVVESREKELGETDTTTAALQAAKEAATGKLKEETPPPKKEPETPPAPEPEQKPPEDSPRRRMAYTTRRS